MKKTYINTPAGLLRLTVAEDGIESIRYWNGQKITDKDAFPGPVLRETIRQLTAYFEGKLTTFDLPLAPQGTTFQQRVWEALQGIPYGSTTTYLELSKNLGDPKAIRAVGKANGQNPIAIVIPCHRVIGSNNKLIGYSGGVERKRLLLQREGALLL